MEKEILRELYKGCNYSERVCIKVLNKLFLKIYKKGFKKGYYIGTS